MRIVTDNTARVLVSSVVVTVLALQSFAGFVDTGRWGWPFVAYPMYNEAHFENERVQYDWVVYAVLEDSSEVIVTPDDLDITWWLFEKNVVSGLLRLDQPRRTVILNDLASAMRNEAELLQYMVNRFCDKTKLPVVGLRLTDMGVAVTRAGMVTGLPRETLASADLVCQ
jgi:hypothetical protein